MVRVFGRAAVESLTSKGRKRGGRKHFPGVGLALHCFAEARTPSNASVQKMAATLRQRPVWGWVNRNSTACSPAGTWTPRMR